MRPDLRLISYFVATAEELHFRRAAERLGIAQPALSRAIQALEAELDVRLFVRSNRKVRITDAGRIFLDHAREVLGALDRGLEDVRRTKDGRAGFLSLGYTDFSIVGALPEILKQFRERQPGIRLNISHGVTLAQLQRLKEGALDVGFVTGPINQEGLDQRIIQSEAFVCVCSDTHPLAKRQSVTLADLEHEDFVHGWSDDWSHFYDYLMPICRRAGFTPRIVQEASNTAGILGLVSCGMGLTILTDKVHSGLPKGLAVLPIDDVTERLLTIALWRRDQRSEPAQNFIRFLRTLPEPPLEGGFCVSGRELLPLQHQSTEEPC